MDRIKILCLLLLSLAPFVSTAQDAYFNACSEGYTIKMMWDVEANRAYTQENQEVSYLNFVLRDGAIYLAGQKIEGASYIMDYLLNNETLSDNPEIIVGVKHGAPFGDMAELICWLKNVAELEKTIYVYHYR